MARNIRLEDIAREAGVSAQTVSRVINNRPDVARKTRRKVQEVIDRLGYLPNTIARSLSSQRTWMMGVVISSIDRYGPGRIFVELDKQAHALGYRLLPYISHDEETVDISRYLRELITHRPDGIIWAAMERAGHEEVLRRNLVPTSIPMVTMEALLPGIPKPAFMDQEETSEALVSHLIEQGYQHIGIITGELLSTQRGKLRINGWKKALEAAGRPITEKQIVHGAWTAETGERAMATLVEQFPEIDAVFACNDQMAQGVLSFAYQHNIRVPDDLGVVGFDDLPEAKYFTPRLTTAKQPFAEFAAITVRTLAEMIDAYLEEESYSPQETKVVYPEIVIRESSVRKT
jgi:LacI family transcriptional regulator